MSGPYGGQDQAPAPAPTGAPGEPAPGAQPESSWQTPAETPSFGVPMASGPTTGVTYADLVPRIIAFVVDAIILNVVFWIAWSLVFTTLFITGGLGGVWVAAIIGLVGYLVASAAYFIYTWTRWRATPGQRILSLETVNADDGATITQDVAIRRWLYLFGPSVLSSVLSLGAGYAIGILSPLVSLAILAYYIYLLYSASQDPRRQGFHDKQVKTVVVKRSA
jgi:uncharacterized RDD family membrane protein YckC